LSPINLIEEARRRIHPYIKKTPLTYDPNLEIYIKWENHQVTGSFKARGAFNKVLTLEKWELMRGLVAASAGNHGQGVALAGNLFKVPVTVFVSENAVPSKILAIQALGAIIRLVPGCYGDAEKTGLEYALKEKANWISPYNDLQVIAGQATIGVEILEELPHSPETAWIVPVGGGGLISGIGAALETMQEQGKKSKKNKTLIGVQSEASPYFYHILNYQSQEHAVELPSLADGLAGPVERNSITIPIVKRLVSDIVLVTEREIEAAIFYAWSQHHEIIEGSAATGLAAILSGKIKHRPAIVIISGGNIQPEIHYEIIFRLDNSLRKF